MNCNIVKSSMFVVLVVSLIATSAHAVSFSVDGPTADRFDTFGWHEDTIFNPMIVPPLPEINIPGHGGPGLEVDAFSYAHHVLSQPDLTTAYFSVDDQSNGVPGSHVFIESQDERASDIYSSQMAGNNVQVWDGDGLNTIAGAPALGVPEPFSTNVDGIDMRYDPQPEILMWDTEPMELIFWSVDQSTASTEPGYVGFGYTEADIFYAEATGGYAGVPNLYAMRGELGLTLNDDIVGLVVVEDGVPGFNPMTDTVYMSIGRDPSATKDALDVTASDILVIGGGSFELRVFADTASLGLADGANINALSFAPLEVIPEPATMSLLALGACLPLFRRKRRQGLAVLRRRRRT